jgi:hypothetical protein
MTPCLKRSWTLVDRSWENDVVPKHRTTLMNPNSTRVSSAQYYFWSPSRQPILLSFV